MDLERWLTVAAALWGAAAGVLVPRAAYRLSVEPDEAWRSACPAGHPITGVAGGWHAGPMHVVDLDQAVRSVRAHCDAIGNAPRVVTSGNFASPVTLLGPLLAELSEVRALWLVEASSGATDRALVIACRASGCSAPMRIDASRVESVLPRDPDAELAPLSPAELADARAWLDEPIPLEAPPPPVDEWWTEPWPWIVGGAVIAGAAAAIAIGASWPQPSERQSFVIDGREPLGR